MERDQFQALLYYVRQGSSIARAALNVELPPDLAYRLDGEHGQALSEAVHDRNQAFGVSWTNDLAATREHALPPGARPKRQALHIARMRAASRTEAEPKQRPMNTAQKRVAAYERIMAQRTATETEDGKGEAEAT